MAPEVRCMCGHAVACDHLEMVVELRCPVCERPLTLEFQGPQGAQRWAILEIVEGPHLLGQSFFIPVGAELLLGSESNAWLALPEGEVAPDHCTLRLDTHGRVTVANLGSPQGTWIGQLRIVQGVLQPGQDLRIGFYRLRLRYENVASTAMASSPGLIGANLPQAVPLVIMKPVEAAETPADWLLQNRYVFIRNVLIGFAWLVGAFDFTHCMFKAGWPPPAALIAGLAVSLLLLGVWRRVSLVAPRQNIAAIGVAAALGLGHFLIGQPMVGVAALLAGGATSLLLLERPRIVHVLCAATLAFMAWFIVLRLIVWLWGRTPPHAASMPFTLGL